MSRFARFNGVGAVGFVLQWTVLAVLVQGLGVHYLPASVIAVEWAVLHNFVWHERWTWRDRPRTGSIARRLWRFHAANGLTSMAGHAAGMAVLVQMCGVSPLVANLPLVAALSLVNFRLGDRFVFSAKNQVDT